MSKCYSMQILVKIKLLVQEILSIISFLLYKFSVFLSAVTLKIRPRSQSPNQGSSMLLCYIMQTLVKIKLLVQEISSIISLFGQNLACFCLQ